MDRIEALMEQRARDATESEERTEKMGGEIVSLREEIEKARGDVVLSSVQHTNEVKNRQLLLYKRNIVQSTL